VVPVAALSGYGAAAAVFAAAVAAVELDDALLAVGLALCAVAHAVATGEVQTAVRVLGAGLAGPLAAAPPLPARETGAALKIACTREPLFDAIAHAFQAGAFAALGRILTGRSPCGAALARRVPANETCAAGLPAIAGITRLRLLAAGNDARPAIALESGTTRRTERAVGALHTATRLTGADTAPQEIAFALERAVERGAAIGRLFTGLGDRIASRSRAAPALAATGAAIRRRLANRTVTATAGRALLRATHEPRAAAVVDEAAHPLGRTDTLVRQACERAAIAVLLTALRRKPAVVGRLPGGAAAPGAHDGCEHREQDPELRHGVRARHRHWYPSRRPIS
jgi:hypothetical protein